jgi:hypothetical protein
MASLHAAPLARTTLREFYGSEGAAASAGEAARASAAAL